MPTSPHYPLGERGASGERADVGSAARRPPFGAQLPHSGGTWRKDRPLRETSPMAPGQARFVDLARPRHPAGERQWVLGCQSMQVSGAGVESYAPSTEPGVGKGGVPLFSPSFGYFSWRCKKSTNIWGTPAGPNNAGRLGKGGVAEGASICRQADANDMQHVTPRNPGPQPRDRDIRPKARRCETRRILPSNFSFIEPLNQRKEHPWRPLKFAI